MNESDSQEKAQYQFFFIGSDLNTLEDYVNTLAEEGWRIVYVISQNGVIVMANPAAQVQGN